MPGFFINNILAKTICEIIARLGGKSKQIENDRKQSMQGFGRCSIDPHVRVVESDNDFYLHFKQRMASGKCVFV